MLDPGRLVPQSWTVVELEVLGDLCVLRGKEESLATEVPENLIRVSLGIMLSYFLCLKP